MTVSQGTSAHEAPSVTHMQWPAERFYWAVLDGSAVTGINAAKRRERLGYLFESVLPGVEIEDVHAVYRAIPNQRYVACGMTRTELGDSVPPHAITLTPETMPSFIDDIGDVDPSEFNLLTGDLLPQPLRKLQRRAMLTTITALTLIALLLVVGLERRRIDFADRTAVVDEQRTAVYDDVLGPRAITTSALPAEQILIAELRSLRQTRRAGKSDSGNQAAGPAMADCSQVLAGLLALWPADIPTQTDSITVTATVITARADVESMTDAQRLADALGSLDGWQLQQPQTQAGATSVNVTLRWEAMP